jgi:hypothetical protein
VHILEDRGRDRKLAKKLPYLLTGNFYNAWIFALSSILYVFLDNIYLLINSTEAVLCVCKGERAKGTDLHSKTAAAAQVGFKLNSF